MNIRISRWVRKGYCSYQVNKNCFWKQLYMRTHSVKSFSEWAFYFYKIYFFNLHILWDVSFSPHYFTNSHLRVSNFHESNSSLRISTHCACTYYVLLVSFLTKLGNLWTFRVVIKSVSFRNTSRSHISSKNPIFVKIKQFS